VPLNRGWIMSERDNKHTTAHAAVRRSDRLVPVVLSVIAVFLLRTLPWAMADLWQDEVITLGDFAVAPPSVFQVFRHYPVANNHMLFSAVVWCWIRALNYNVSSFLLRLPSLLFACCTLAWMATGWRRHVGKRQAFYAALLFAIGPVYAGFACQLRGYALTLLLSTVLLSDSLDIVTDHKRYGTLRGWLAALLLPLVIPINLLTVIAHGLFVLASGRHDASARSWRRQLWSAVPHCACGVIGAAYYLNIWPQFAKVAAQTTGWSNGWVVAGHLVIALFVHAAPVFLVLIVFLWTRKRSGNSCAKDTTDSDRRRGARLLLCATATVGTVLLLLRPAPYPRVFLVLLPTFTCALFMMTRSADLWRTLNPMIAVVVILGNGVLCERIAGTLADRDLRRGHYDQDLLRHYYRGNSAFSRLCQQLVQDEQHRDVVLAANAYDSPSVRFYAALAGFPPGRVLAEGRGLGDTPIYQFTRAGLRVLIVAPCPAEARRLAAALTGVVMPEPIATSGAYGLYEAFPQ